MLKTSRLRCALFAGLFLICAGCATPNGRVPAEQIEPGMSVPSSTRVLGQASVYLSAAGEKLEVVHDPAADIAIVKLPDGGLVLLPAEIAGSEGRYRDSRMTVWENEGGVLLWIAGKLVFSGRGAK